MWNISETKYFSTWQLIAAAFSKKYYKLCALYKKTIDVVLLPGAMVDYLHISTHHTLRMRFFLIQMHLLTVFLLSSLVSTDFNAIFPHPQIILKKISCIHCLVYYIFFWHACSPCMTCVVYQTVATQIFSIISRDVVCGKLRLMHIGEI